jgi:putative phage-type endonuclease
MNNEVKKSKKMNESLNLHKVKELIKLVETMEFCEEIHSKIFYELSEYVENNYHIISNINYEEHLIDVLEKITKNNIHIIPITYDLFKKWINTLFPIPRQMGFTSDIHRLDNVEDKVKYLLDSTNEAQGSDEWHLKRGTMITASNAYKVFGSNSVKNSLIYEKCNAFNGKISFNNYTNMPTSLEWGHIFEPATVALYEYMFDTKIANLGCIVHSKYDFIGASPDGINILHESPLYGRIIEIKNVISRVIDGYPIFEYWIQMQQQMEVCDIDLCDFIETQYHRYDCFSEFIEDSENEHNVMRSKDDCIKGVVIHTSDGFDAIPITEMSKENWIEYHNCIVDELGDKWIRTIYYKLIDWSCVLVPRNKKWFDIAAVPALTNMWDIITNEKNMDYSHRAPKKRAIKNKNQCMIDFSSSSDFSEPSI